MSLLTRHLKLRYRQITGTFRVLPSFVILGVQKAGTTSLYEYLIQHPQVLPPQKKEIHYFDLNYQYGINWYRSFFPLKSDMEKHEKVSKKRALTGEATPYYLFYPWSAGRIFEQIPNAKLIVLLRNPIDRAYSHFRQEIRRNTETLSFEMAIESENERLKNERKKVMNDEIYHSPTLQDFSYISRGLYIDQLKAFGRYFSRQQMLILKSESFFEKPQSTYDRVLSFLDLDPMQLENPIAYNAGNDEEDISHIRPQLATIFKAHNQRLYEFVGENWKW